jgi:hypothetical protein
MTLHRQDAAIVPLLVFDRADTEVRTRCLKYLDGITPRQGIEKSLAIRLREHVSQIALMTDSIAMIRSLSSDGRRCVFVIVKLVEALLKGLCRTPRHDPVVIFVSHMGQS